MKGYVEQKGVVSRLVYDEISQAFVSRPIPHPFPNEHAAGLAQQSSSQSTSEMEANWQEAAE